MQLTSISKAGTSASILNLARGPKMSGDDQWMPLDRDTPRTSKLKRDNLKTTS